MAVFVERPYGHRPDPWHLVPVNEECERDWRHTTIGSCRNWWFHREEE